MEALSEARNALRFYRGDSSIDDMIFKTQQGKTTIQLLLGGSCGGNEDQKRTRRVLDFIEQDVLCHGSSCEVTAPLTTESRTLVLTVDRDVTGAGEDFSTSSAASDHLPPSCSDAVAGDDEKDDSDEDQIDDEMEGVLESGPNQSESPAAAAPQMRLNSSPTVAESAPSSISSVNDVERRQQENSLQQESQVQLSAQTSASGCTVTARPIPAPLSFASSSSENNRPQQQQHRQGIRKRRSAPRTAGGEQLSRLERKRRYVEELTQDNPPVPITRAQFDTYVRKYLETSRSRTGFGYVSMMREFKIGYRQAVAVYNFAKGTTQLPSIEFAEPETEQPSGVVVDVACNPPAASSAIVMPSPSSAAAAVVAVSDSPASPPVEDEAEMDVAGAVDDDDDIQFSHVVKRLTCPASDVQPTATAACESSQAQVKLEQLDIVSPQTFDQRKETVRLYLQDSANNGLRTRNQRALGELTAKALAERAGFRTEREAFFFVLNYLKEYMPRSWHRLPFSDDDG